MGREGEAELELELRNSKSRDDEGSLTNRAVAKSWCVSFPKLITSNKYFVPLAEEFVVCLTCVARMLSGALPSTRQKITLVPEHTNSFMNMTCMCGKLENDNCADASLKTRAT